MSTSSMNFFGLNLGSGGWRPHRKTNKGFVIRILPSSRLPTLLAAVVGASFNLPSPATAATAAATTPLIICDPDIENMKASRCLSTLACPVCYEPFKTVIDSTSTNLECEMCGKAYPGNEAYLDLTIRTAVAKDYAQITSRRTELFRIPLVSYLYERGWRQRFVWGGFPGAEKEFEMAKGYLKPTFGGTIIDASCGSGLFSRMFSKSGLYKAVVALDFSETMLKQCSDYIKKEGISRDNLVVVRADIARLPFESGSIDAVHAGAAMHCWPSPSSAVAEINRVLRPGGKFVATTFLTEGIYNRFPHSLVRQVFVGVTGHYISTSQGELEDLLKANGFDGFTCVRNRWFVMMSATKPG